MMGKIAIFTTAMNLVSDALQAKDQNERAQKLYENMVEQTYEGLNIDLTMQEMQQQQIEEAQQRRIHQRQVQTLRDRSRIMASASDAGVGGPSVDRLLGYYEMDAAQDEAAHQRQMEIQLQQSAAEAEGMVRQAEDRIQRAANQRQEQTVNNPWLQSAFRHLPSAAAQYAQTQVADVEGPQPQAQGPTAAQGAQAGLRQRDMQADPDAYTRRPQPDLRR